MALFLEDVLLGHGLLPLLTELLIFLLDKSKEAADRETIDLIYDALNGLAEFDNLKHGMVLDH